MNLPASVHKAVTDHLKMPLQVGGWMAELAPRVEKQVVLGEAEVQQARFCLYITIKKSSPTIRKLFEPPYPLCKLPL